MKDFKIKQNVDELLSQLQLDDAPAGGALVVYHQGECVFQGGIGQSNDEKMWTADTLSLNFSAGKGVLATLVHVLVSKGWLNYEQPIADIWKEFGSQGKQNITLRSVLSHQAGLFDITSVTNDSQDMLDWHLMLDNVAQMKPKPFSEKESSVYSSVYSALVYGWVIGGLIEKRLGKPLQSVLREYLTEPLDIAESVFFGVPLDKLSDVAQPKRRFDSVMNTTVDDSKHIRKKPVLKPDGQLRLSVYQQAPSADCWQAKLGDKVLNTTNINALYFDTSVLDVLAYKQALVPNGQHDFDYYDDDVLTAVIPAANGVSSANALAKIYAMLSQKGWWQGQNFIDDKTFLALSRIQGQKRDKVMPAVEPESMLWRMGYHRLFSVCHQAEHAFGHMGYNGSVAWCDNERQLSFAFVHNFDTTMLNDVRQFILTEAILSSY